MTVLETVIKALECCTTTDEQGFPRCEECPYADSDGTCPDIDAMHRHAMELLKSREPRVMTLEETKAFGWDYCYLEELRLPGKEYRAVCGDYALMCITWPCTTSMRIQHGDGNYNKTWRCWTEKPTEEQRKAVKWE